MDLKVDPARMQEWDGVSGIQVRGTLNGQAGTVDVAVLDKASLRLWLRSRGGNNPFAEDAMAMALGHGPFDKQVLVGVEPMAFGKIEKRLDVAAVVAAAVKDMANRGLVPAGETEDEVNQRGRYIRCLTTAMNEKLGYAE